MFWLKLLLVLCANCARQCSRSVVCLRVAARGPLSDAALSVHCCELRPSGASKRSAVIALGCKSAVLSSCIGGNALQGTPVQDPSVVTFLSNFTARDQWREAPRRPKAEDLAGLDPEKVYFETCLLQKLGESWTIWDTRDLRSHQSAVRLAVFRTSTTTTTTTTVLLLLLLLLLRRLLLLLLRRLLLLLRRRRRLLLHCVSVLCKEWLLPEGCQL